MKTLGEIVYSCTTASATAMRDAVGARPFGGLLLQEAVEHVPVLLRAGALRL